MPTRNIWIASLLALFLSLGVIGGTMMMRLNAIVARIAPVEVEETVNRAEKVYWDRYFSQLYELEESMAEKEKSFEARELALEEANKELEAREESITARALELERSRREIQGWFITYSENEKANYQRIAKTYAVMEAQKVVPILLASPTEDVAKVLLELKPENLAPIWTAILDASNTTEANAKSISTLIELMGRIHTGIEPADTSSAATATPPPVETGPPSSASSTGGAATEALFPQKNGELPMDFSSDEIALHQRIAKTYLNMAPDKVAPILLATPPRDAAGVLLQMKPEAIAVIWSAIIDRSRLEEGATEKVVVMAEYMRRNRNGV